MPLATKNNAIIVKDGKLAEDCGCCGGGWYCDSVCQEVTRRGLTVSVSLENVTPVGISPLTKVDESKGYLDDLGGVAFPVSLAAPTSPDLSLDRWPSGVVKTNASTSDPLYYEKGSGYKLSLHCERYCYILYGYSQTVSASLVAGASGGPMASLGVPVPSFECTMTMSLDATSATFGGHYAGRLNVSGYAGNAGLVFSTTVPFSPSGFSTRRNAVSCSDMFTPSRVWLCDIVINTTAA